MQKQGVLIRKSTGEIIKRGDYPNLDMEPIQGLDPDLEWLLVHEPFKEPEYDPRIYVMGKNEEITAEPHPEHPLINQFKLTYLLIRRSNEEIQVAVENAESFANEALVPYDRRLKILTLGIAVLFRKLEGVTLTARERDIAEKIAALGSKVWKNDANARAKSAEIIVGGDPNLDALWER